jgi:hypothetical protein
MRTEGSLHRRIEKIIIPRQSFDPCHLIISIHMKESPFYRIDGRRLLPSSARLDFSDRANLSSLRAPLAAKSAFSKNWIFARPCRDWLSQVRAICFLTSPRKPSGKPTPFVTSLALLVRWLEVGLAAHCHQAGENPAAGRNNPAPRTYRDQRPKPGIER